MYAARLAHDAGHGVSELYTSWLDTPAEEAVIEARVEYATEDEHHEQLHGEVTKILDALRDNGYEPALRIEDITISGGEPGPGGTPAPPIDTVGGGAEDPNARLKSSRRHEKPAVQARVPPSKQPHARADRLAAPLSASSVSVPPDEEKTRKLMRSRER